MWDAGSDKDDRAGPHVANFVTDADLPGTGDDVIDLVLGVRLLEIRLTRGQDVEPDADVGNRDELQLGRSGCGPPCRDIGALVSVHQPTIAGRVTRRSAGNRIGRPDVP